MSMPRLAALRPQDLNAVHGLVPELLETVRWHVSTPYALALGARNGADLSGLLLAIRHATSAHLSTLYVHPDHRGTGVGPQLMRTALEDLERGGARSHVVMSPPEVTDYFGRFGFRPEGEFLRYAGGRHVQATMHAVVHAEPQHWLAICHLDRKATGEDRSEWLREHDFLANVWQEQGRVRGFLLALAGEGLIIADHPIIGLELQRWQLPVQDHITLPAGQPEVHEHLVKQRYSPTPAFVRMVRGAAIPWQAGMVFGW